MHDPIKASTNTLSPPRVSRDAFPIWTILLSLGVALCAGVAAYEAYHFRRGFWWAYGALLFMLAEFLIRQGVSPFKAKEKGDQSSTAQVASWKQTTMVFGLLLAMIFTTFKVDTLFGAALFLLVLVFHTFGGFPVAQQCAEASRGKLIRFAITWLIVIFLAVGSLLVYPEFASLFSSFGGDLPLLTHLVLSYHRLFLIWPIGMLLVWAFLPELARRLQVTSRLGIASIVLMVLAAGTMYLPILKMGSVV